MGDTIKYLYSQLILRDVLSFITPGAIIVFTAIFLLSPDILERHLSWPLYIPLFGLFFLVGFAVQCFGESLDIIRFTPRGRGSWRQRFNIFCCKWNRDYKNAGKPENNSNIWWWEDHEFDADFSKATERNEGAQQSRERMVVLQQMCANGFLASVIAGTFLVVNRFPWTYANISWVSLWALLLTASLFWGYRIHVLRRFTIQTIALNRWERNRKGQS